jgi:hypothetical protein
MPKSKTITFLLAAATSLATHNISVLACSDAAKDRSLRPHMGAIRRACNK